MSLELTITPSGHLTLLEQFSGQETAADPSKPVIAAFGISASHGLLHLATHELQARLAAPLDFVRSFARTYLTRLCQTQPDEATKVVPPMLTRQKWLGEGTWHLVILDEAQAIRNAGTRQARAVKELRAAGRIALTGTPVENRLSDLWSLFDFLNPGLLGNAKGFATFVKQMEARAEPSVVDLQIQQGKITALVSGSELYTVTIHITPVAAAHWQGLKTRCAGQIGSLVELLQGRLSKGVMDLVTAHEGGLFPKPREIKLSCSCPDWAGMCKHVAAVLYGVGARLDRQPELLFLLRQVDHLQLIEEAVPQAGKKSSTGKKTLVASEVADVFGIELADPEASTSAPAPSTQTAKPRRRVDRGSQKVVSKPHKVGRAIQLAKGASKKTKAASAAQGARRGKKVEAVSD
jgi:uncharacterized Zn finger protein